MAYFLFDDIEIVGIEGAVPTNIVKTEEYSDLFGEEDVNRFIKMSGVKEHHVASKYQTASDLGFIAAQKMIERLNIEKEKIGVLAFASHSPDYRWPATALVLQGELGLSEECAAFDISLGCSGGVYGMQIMCSMLKTGDFEYGLLIVGETQNKLVNRLDKANVLLLGDGCVAVLFRKCQTNNKIIGCLKSKGVGFKNIIVPAGGLRNMYADNKEYKWNDGNVRNLYQTYLDGVAVFSFAIDEVPQMINEFMDRNGVDSNNFDCIAIHQANEMIINRIAKRCGFAREKIPFCMDRYGNTSGCSALMSIIDRYQNVNADKNIKILMSGFGVGLSYGVIAFSINNNAIGKIHETDYYFEDGIINSPEDI